MLNNQKYNMNTFQYPSACWFGEIGIFDLDVFWATLKITLIARGANISG
jgi:hypothetical protein